MRAFAASFVLALLALAPACGQSTTSTSSSSASGSSSSSGVGPSTCTDALEAAAKLCSAEASRACYFKALEDLCTTGRGDAVAASAACFDTGVCHTFADPGETKVETCLAASYDAFKTSSSEAVRATYCMVCTSSCSGSPVKTPIPFEHLSVGQASALDSCLKTVKACDATVDACFTKIVPGLAACP